MKKLLFISGLVSLLSSCSPKMPFTQAVREKYQLTESEMKQLQFYASHDIIMQRVEQEGKSKTTEEGKLKITDGKSYDQVLIKAGTPGVIDKVIDEKRISVSFEDGQGRFIVFGDPNDKKGNYTLLAADWKNNRGVLQYGGQEYYIAQGASNIYVQFKMKKLNNIKKQTRVAKGKKL